MRIITFLKDELTRSLWVSLYFFLCLGIIALLKKLFLAQYNIEFYGLSLVILGTLIAGKVVPLLDHISLEKRFPTFPRWVNVLYKTFIMSAAVFVVYTLEKIFHGYHETGGLREGIKLVYENRELNRFLATNLCVGLSFLIFNLFSEINHYLGKGGVKRIFFSVRDR